MSCSDPVDVVEEVSILVLAHDDHNWKWIQDWLETAFNGIAELHGCDIWVLMCPMPLARKGSYELRRRMTVQH